MNSPMPTAIAFRMLGLMTSRIAWRMPRSDRARKRTPAMKVHAQCNLPRRDGARFKRSRRNSCVNQSGGCGDDRQGENEVLAHTGRLGNRKSGIKSHDGGRHGRGQASCHHDRTVIHPVGSVEIAAGEHHGLQEDDVGHGQKGGQPRQQFRTDSGIVFT